jgi:hypothetical protein
MVLNPDDAAGLTAQAKLNRFHPGPPLLARRLDLSYCPAPTRIGRGTGHRLMAKAARMAKQLERAALSRLIAALLLVAFGFQSYIAQTHIHDIAAKTPAAMVQHSGHNRAPVQNSPLDCSFCQMLTQAGSTLIPDAALLVPAPQWIMMAVPYYLLAGTGTTANPYWQSRAPPSV